MRDLAVVEGLAVFEVVGERAESATEDQGDLSGLVDALLKIPAFSGMGTPSLAALVQSKSSRLLKKGQTALPLRKKKQNGLRLKKRPKKLMLLKKKQNQLRLRKKKQNELLLKKMHQESLLKKR